MSNKTLCYTISTRTHYRPFICNAFLFYFVTINIHRAASSSNHHQRSQLRCPRNDPQTLCYSDVAQVSQERTTTTHEVRFQQQGTNTNTCEPADPNQILAALFTILRGNLFQYSVPNESPVSALYRSTVLDGSVPDENNNNNNNNNDETSRSQIPRSGCSAKRFCSIPYRQEKFRRKMFSGMKKYSHPRKSLQSSDCTCGSLTKCNLFKDCASRCCGPAKVLSCRTPEMRNESKEGIEFKDPKSREAAFRNCAAGCSGPTYISRQLQDEGKPFNCWECCNVGQSTGDAPKNDETLQEYVKHLDKCRELVTGINGIPMKEIPDRAKIADPLQRGGVRGQSKTEAHRSESRCSADCTNDCIEITSSPSGSFPLVIADGQGLLELHIVSLQLSTSAKQILLSEKEFGNVSLFVSWDMWNQETAYTPTRKCPRLNFNSSFVYRIPDLFSFFNFILLEFVVFQVNVFHEDNGSYAVATGKLCIKDILDYPQNKLYYIAPVNSAIPCSVGVNFGQLSLWVRLSCDVEKVEAFTRRQKTQWDVGDKRIADVETTEATVAGSKADLLVLKDRTSKEHLGYETSKEMLLRKDAAKAELEETSSDTSGELSAKMQLPVKTKSLAMERNSEEESQPSMESKYLNDHHRLLYTDAVDDTGDGTRSGDLVSQSAKEKDAVDAAEKKSEDVKQSSSMIEFNTIVSNGVLSKDSSNESFGEVTNVISEKNWEKYKQRSLITFGESAIVRTGDASEVDATNHIDSQPPEKDAIIIEIASMTLLPNTSLMRNDEYQLLYIEYSFLGYCGADMETVSVRKPTPPNQKLAYNFRRKFRVDEEKHLVQNNILRAMLDGTANPNIKFIVVCEPLPEEPDTKECVEVGFANFNIREYALGNGDRTVTLPIFSQDESEQIGLLKIYLLGRDTIRQYLGRRESNM